MSRTIDGKRRAHFACVAIFVMLAVGCARGSTMKSNGPKGQFGNGQETLDYVDGLGFTADTAYIAGYACNGCPAAGVRLMFLPRENAQSLNWQGDLRPGAAGDVVAQVVNVDNVAFTDGGFTLAPNEVAFVWVGEVRYNGAPTRGFGVYRLNDAGYVAGEWSVVPLNNIKYCRNNRPRRKPAIKNHHEGPPSDCEPIALASGSDENRLAGLGVSAAYAATSRAVSTVLGGLGGLWITCSGGCCQVSTT